jgi:UDP-2,4-diacetamido-2,4,6-trideoxy-beta-L-altropyranose hydrolase
MHCVFIVQASSSIGLGHLLRCLGLSQQLVKLGYSATFLLDEETSQYARLRNDWQGNIRIINYDNLERFLAELKSNKSYAVDWLVVDGYQFSNTFLKTLKQMDFRVALFDDDVHEQPYHADIVINSSSNSIESDGLSAQCKMLSGDKFRLLRQDFQNIEFVPIEQREKLTICFGGSDPANLTLPLLKELDSATDIDDVHVIIGPGCLHAEEIKAFSDNCCITVHLYENVQNMAELWSNTRLAISAAGGSQFELAVCATPAILVVVADNQLSAADQTSKIGWAKVHRLESNKKVLIRNIILDVKALWGDDRKLIKMHELVKNKFDAMGANRIVCQMQARLNAEC